MKARTLIGQSTFSKLPALKISAPSAKHRHRKLTNNGDRGILWMTKTKWMKAMRFHRRSDKKQSVVGRTGVKRREISARPQEQWAMNSSVERKRDGMMRSLVSAVFRTTASDTSARTRR